MITTHLGIAGGGLAGLALALQMGRAGYNVVLFEKNNYPRHKVCGEYISLESYPFLCNLLPQLRSMDLPIMKQLLVTAPSGKAIRASLPLGGFGISRYLLDLLLAQEVQKLENVTLLTGTTVQNITPVEGGFQFNTSAGQFITQQAAGSHGKWSNLDKALATTPPKSSTNYIGVKYHLPAAPTVPIDEIQLHNFQDGYCGISRVEDGQYCMCYLTTAANLKKAGSILAMEETILSKNPVMAQLLTLPRSYEQPLTISNVTFHPKPSHANGILLLGDAAGMITPLCGNGMSMALHASSLAAQHLHQYFLGSASQMDTLLNYERDWQQHFGLRLKVGRTVQRFFGSSLLSNILLSTVGSIPAATRALVKATHGQPFDAFEI